MVLLCTTTEASFLYEDKTMLILSLIGFLLIQEALNEMEVWL